MFTIQLDCGRNVTVDAIYSHRTYSGILAGHPNQSTNYQLMHRAFNRMEPLWGSRKTYMIPPEIDQTDAARPRLPPIEITVWLTCNDPIQPTSDGSELVVIFYGQSWGDDTLSEVLQREIKSLPWTEHAEDFDW